MIDSLENVKNSIGSLEDLNNYLLKQDRLVNVTYISEIAKSCKDNPCLVGIDEAGRGPVLGPMVYGIAFCPISQSQMLKDLECADSKALKEEDRDSIFSKMIERSEDMGWAVEVISPTTICKSMFSRQKVSLNDVSMNSAIHLLRLIISAGVNVAEIYVDTVGPDKKYEKYLSSLFPDYKITVSKKADSIYPIVSAASICAKVTRDHALQVWQFAEGIPITHKEFGSGYPGDPTTKKFLTDYLDPVFGFPQLVRFSWSTAETLLEKHAHTMTCESKQENENKSEKTIQLTNYFQVFKKKNNEILHPKHRFFTERNLTTVTDF